jgi:hypothetical protein
MAGSVNTSCHAVRAELTELLMLGRPLPAPLAAHLAGCVECAAEAEGVRRVVRTFERAQSPLAARHGMSPARPSWTPPGTSARPGRSYVHGRRRVALAAAAVALACCAVVTVAVANGGDRGAYAAQVTLSQEGRMVPRSWGTEVPVTLSGLRPGQTYRLMTADAEGQRVPAGSLRADGSALHTRMMTAMSRQQITMLLVQDKHGHLVASFEVAPPPATEGA